MMIHVCKFSDILPQKWIWVQKLGFTATFWHLIYLVYFQELTLLSLVRVLVDMALTSASAVPEPALGDAVAAFSQPTRNMWLLCDCIHSCPAHWNKTVTRTIWKQLLHTFKKRTSIYFCMQHPLLPTVPEFHIHLTQLHTALWHYFLNAGLNLTADPLWASFNWTHYKLLNRISVCTENIKIASHQLTKRTRFNECWSKYKINFSGVTLCSVAKTFMMSQKTISFLRILLHAGSSTDHQVTEIQYTLSYCFCLNKHFSLTVIPW